MLKRSNDKIVIKEHVADIHYKRLANEAVEESDRILRVEA